MGAAAHERLGPAKSGEGERLVPVRARPERERQAGGEAVAAPVGILDRPGRRHGAERAARLRPAAERAGGGDDEPWRRVELAWVIALALVLAAPHERIQLHAAATEGV